jgi:catechol 2,3-dioxygenase-like lactoylglutathione lyase family enzyme
MSLVSGINHIAVVTQDLARFVEFYRSIFGMELLFEEHAPAFSHAILRSGESSWLHPAAVSGNQHGAALPEMFRRGHLDHIALTAPSAQAFALLRERLLERGATNGSVEDLGAFHALWFQDPDGMRGELCLIVDPALRTFHAPVPLAAS